DPDGQAAGHAALAPGESQPPGPEDELAMRDQVRLTRPVVASLPADIDIANAEHAGERRRGAFAVGVSAVAEMGLTVFCCTSGCRQPAASRKRAMSWLTNPESRIGDLPSLKSCESKSGGSLSSRPPPRCWLRAYGPAARSRLLIAQG